MLDETFTDSHKRLQQSPVTAWCVNNTEGNRYLCPRTSVCTSDYSFCPYASPTCNST